VRNKCDAFGCGAFNIHHDGGGHDSSVSGFRQGLYLLR
jgi:hypothetical protein